MVDDQKLLDREGLLELARRWLIVLGELDADGNRNIEALMAMLCDEIDYQIPFLEQPFHLVGSAAVRTFMESMQGLFSDIRYEVETLYADVAAQTAVFEMTSSRLILPDRLVYANRYVFRLTARGNQVCAIREYVNPLPAQELSRRLKLGSGNT
ncbi:nuclear transport factor 2 family protein [Novosphingobium sp. PASSN1]|uniref:nuclear transport factor 2 family protein n=1 Tax=Novosphingobium sp. PASSN1 TaxID=2015561 RepID=UPI000BD66D6E|nr:nuclear transport factor 2 family protein [Novosphingobium sp. PASSN1]OYU34804.1 MAG: hypothetical protein CFE35_13005 [Novosphingobium sp. PASSN1]